MENKLIFGKVKAYDNTGNQSLFEKIFLFGV